jgi:tetraacyldisaccharide 4'-kinase
MSIKRFAQRAIEGEVGLAASAYRALAGVAAPFYAAGVRWRNRAFDNDPSRSIPLGRPTISVGNLSAGGTGKTPVVLWLCRRLRDAGRFPGVLMRGYGDDEHRMLAAALGDVPVVANPDRVAGARRMLDEHPKVDVLVLDDGFQHRRAARDFDLVLLSMTQMTGPLRLLPRGLLREPLESLRRAHAVLLTRCDLASVEAIDRVERMVKSIHPSIRIYRSRQIHTNASRAMLVGHRFFAFAGIGDPGALDRQLASYPAGYAGSRWFDDHHAYTAADLRAVESAARAAGAELLVTTEKDWIKLAPLAGSLTLPCHRLKLEMRFEADHETRLMEQIEAVAGS